MKKVMIVLALSSMMTIAGCTMKEIKTNAWKALIVADVFGLIEDPNSEGG